jgi:putative ABC transport system permease protein
VYAAAIVAPGTATKIGVGTTYDGAVVFDTRHAPTDAQVQAVDKVLRDAHLAPDLLRVERGYVADGFGYGLLALALGSAIVTVGATAVTTGLALAEARPDLATLGAVGAAPRVRRTLAASQAGVVAVLGVVFGTLAGLGLAYTIVISQHGWPFTFPWPTLAGTVVGLPLFAAAVAWLLTRSRTPLDRRLT